MPSPITNIIQFSNICDGSRRACLEGALCVMLFGRRLPSVDAGADYLLIGTAVKGWVLEKKQRLEEFGAQ